MCIRDSDYIDPEVIMTDIRHVLHDRSHAARQEASYIEKIESEL